MKQEDIINMACEAGLAEWHEHIQSHGFKFATPDYLERFAALIAAHEREECARVCEWLIGWQTAEERQAVDICAEAIRARGE